MSDGNEKLKDVPNDEQNSQSTEASGSIMECDPHVPQNSNRDNQGRICNLFMGEQTVPPARKEILKAAEGIQNMAIAHEIAINKNFKIDKVEPEDGTLHKRVKDLLHKAYWDILCKQLSQNPPVYTNALLLLEEIKQSLDELLLPHNARTKETMNEILDIALIKQQAENGVLDFSRYAKYIISLMAKMCAPVRDERIAKLKECTDVIETFKGIMEVLELMKMDLTNFTLDMYRPAIVASSIEYEKRKFAEYLKVQTDGLQNTRKWLLRHLTPEIINTFSANANSVKQITYYLLTEAYLDLLEFDFYANAETLMLDEARITDLCNKTSRLAINGSILLLLKPLPYILTDQHKNMIKEHVMVLLESVNSNKDLEAIMPNILVQVKADIQKVKQESTNGLENPEQNHLSIIENQILELFKPDHKVRQLVTYRIRQFLKSVIVTRSAPQQIPPGLSFLEKELAEIASQLVVFINRNKIVFEEYYQYIVTTAINDKQLPGCNASTIETKA